MLALGSAEVPMRNMLVLLLCSLALSPLQVSAQAWSPGFGRDWVRSQAFTLGGLNIRTESLDLAEYRAAGFESLLAWEDVHAQVAIAGAGSLPWHAHIRPANVGVTDHIRSQVSGAAIQPGGLGWLLHDEPNRLDMPGIGEVATWLRAQHPGSLVYCNAFPSYASPAQLYGDDSMPGYRWQDYLRDYVDLIDPDVLLYDHYPFRADGRLTAGFYSDLMTVRRVALERGIPYWSFMQSWGNADKRVPSESDLRAHVYSHLAAGYQGLFYFTYDAWDDGGLLGPGGTPTALYGAASRVNAEVNHLGHVLRYLSSVEVRFVAGQLLPAVDNPVPDGLNAWSPGAGRDGRMVRAGVDTSGADAYGLQKNGLLGFFEDDSGQRYFMLVNMSHGAGDTAASRSLPFELAFDGGLSSLAEFDSSTGRARHVPLDEGWLRVTLPGGTGRLYGYGASTFAPDVEAPPVDASDPGTSLVAGGADGGVPDAGTPDATVDVSVDSGASTDAGSTPTGSGGCGVSPGHGSGHALVLLFGLVALGRLGRRWR